MKYIEKVFDVITGETSIIERNYTDAELAFIKAEEEKNEAAKIEAESKAAAKAALLERLGITEEEAKLLLG